MNRFILLSIGFMILISTWSCSQGAKYKQMERRELASGERHDSLFLGIYFGMESKPFFDHCWQMNKEHLVKEGPGSATVEYIPPDFKEKTQMLFYPKFYENKIYQMPVEFSYEAWAPWNKELFSDKLQLEVVRVLEKWYGKGFIKLHYKTHGDLYVKVDGNRRISVWIEDDQKVKVLFTDVMIDNKIKEENKTKRLSSK